MDQGWEQCALRLRVDPERGIAIDLLRARARANTLTSQPSSVDHQACQYKRVSTEAPHRPLLSTLRFRINSSSSLGLSWAGLSSD